MDSLSFWVKSGPNNMFGSHLIHTSNGRFLRCQAKNQNRKYVFSQYMFFHLLTDRTQIRFAHRFGTSGVFHHRRYPRSTTQTAGHIGLAYKLCSFYKPL